MKATITALILSLMTASSAFAAADSVGVFYRPEKVVVLINEDYRTSRLAEMMDALGLGEKALLLSSDESIKIDCGRNAQAASCTFRFLPSAIVNVGHKNVEVLVTAEELKLPQAPAFEMVFESSMADRFVMQVAHGKVYFFANKRGAGKN